MARDFGELQNDILQGCLRQALGDGDLPPSTPDFDDLVKRLEKSGADQRRSSAASDVTTSILRQRESAVVHQRQAR